MSLLNKVTRGKQKRPLLAIIYGPDGVGKTTFACSAPKPLYMGREDGLPSDLDADVPKLPIVKSYQEIMTTLEELRTESHDYQTLVCDSLDWIEPLIWQAVCELDGATHIDKAQGGYGKGYVVANQYWSKMMDALTLLRAEKKMNIIMIAHSQIKAFNDPSQPAPYDRYQLKLNDKAAALWREYVEFVGFATYEVFTKKNNTNDAKTKAYGEGKRVLYTERRPSFDAKNRLGLPFELPLSYEAIQEAVNKGIPSGDLKKEALALLEFVTDEPTKKAVIDSIEKSETNSAKMAQIVNRLKVITQGRQT